MTRKKDRKKQKQESMIIKKKEEKSRLKKVLEEKKQEIHLLNKIKDLSDELIRIIYHFMTGNAKLICNFKLEYLAKKILTYDFYNTLCILEYLQKKEILHLIRKGFLHQYQDIIHSINGYFYCLDKNEYSDVYGHRLFDLWDNNHLKNVASSEEKIRDYYIKSEIRLVVKDYITDFILLFNRNKNRIQSQKNWDYKGNTLFTKVDKVFYLYKCLEDLVNKIKKKTNKIYF